MQSCGEYEHIVLLLLVPGCVLTISIILAMVHSSLVCDILCQTCTERMKLRFAVVLWKG